MSHLNDVEVSSTMCIAFDQISTLALNSPDVDASRNSGGRSLFGRLSAERVFFAVDLSCSPALSLPSLLLQTSSQQKTKSIFAEETLTSHRIIGICRSLNGDGRRGSLVGKQISTFVRKEEVDFTCGDPTGIKMPGCRSSPLYTCSRAHHQNNTDAGKQMSISVCCPASRSQNVIRPLCWSVCRSAGLLIKTSLLFSTSGSHSRSQVFPLTRRLSFDRQAAVILD